jgi:hypothetical protein
MQQLIEAVKLDVNFIRGHQVQPKWFKALKIFILLGVVGGYWALFGGAKTFLFFTVFLLLMLAVHLAYRIGTHTWQRSWLDLVVAENDGVLTAVRIGNFYYVSILIHAAIAFILSQTLGS